MQKFLLFVPLLLALFVISGCETVKGAANGLKKDVESLSDPDSPINQADAWVQEHMW
jgi:predicted small secreted protein